MSKPTKYLYEFGPFHIDPLKRVLMRGGQPVPLTPKAFDTLLALIENNERVIEKDELMQTVWPDTVVEEGGLTRNISVLRKVLGESPDEHQYIVTVPGRGYRFVANVKEVRDGSSDLINQEHLGSNVLAEDHETIRKGSGIEAERAFEAKTFAAEEPAREVRRGLNRAVLTACLLLVGLVGGLSYSWITSRSKQADPGAAVRSIAVLPFKPLSADSRDESLEIGMADTLITKLSSLSQIVVRPISSVRKYTGVDQDPLATGRELMVDSVLDGSIQKTAERMRVTVRLVNVRDGRPLWADKFDENFTDIFRAQDSISERVAGALSLKLTGEEKKSLTKHYTENAEAYQLYLQGRYYLHEFTIEALVKSGEYFQRAIEKDPNYPLAYAGLANYYAATVFLGQMPPKEAWQKSEEAAVKALAIDDTLGEAHCALARVKLWQDWAWAGAERELKRAIELNAEFAEPHTLYARLLGATGRFDEAVAEAKRSREVDPLAEHFRVYVGEILYNARRYDEAIEELRKELEKDPDSIEVYLCLGEVYVKQGRYEEALAEMHNARIHVRSPRQLARIGAVYAAAGKRDEAIKILEEVKGLTSKRNDLGTHIAAIYSALANKDQAFAWLDNAYEARTYGLIELKVSPKFDALRSDPRFEELLARMHLAP